MSIKGYLREGTKVAILDSMDYPDFVGKKGIISCYCSYGIYEIIVDNDTNNPIYLYASQIKVLNKGDFKVGDVVAWGSYDRGVVSEILNDESVLVAVSSHYYILKRKSELVHLLPIKTEGTAW